MAVLRSEKKKIIEKVMEKETYKVKLTNLNCRMQMINHICAQLGCRRYP